MGFSKDITLADLRKNGDVAPEILVNDLGFAFNKQAILLSSLCDLKIYSPSLKLQSSALQYSSIFPMFSAQMPENKSLSFKVSKYLCINV